MTDIKLTFGLLTGLILVLSSPIKAQQSVTVLLAGYKQIPPVPSPGTGSATVMMLGDTLSVKGYFNQLSSAYYGAYIHFGDKDERGNQLFRIECDLNENETGGTFAPEANQWALNESHRQALAEGLLYISIYSTDYPRGELRGQIPPME